MNKPDYDSSRNSDAVGGGFFAPPAEPIAIELINKDGSIFRTSPFAEVELGWIVSRNLGGASIELFVSAVDQRFIHCGPVGAGWKFDRLSGIEVDEEIGWGPQFGRVGSYLTDARRPTEEELRTRSEPGRELPG